MTAPPINELRINGGMYEEYFNNFSDDSDMAPPPRSITIWNENGVTVGDVSILVMLNSTCLLTSTLYDN